MIVWISDELADHVDDLIVILTDVARHEYPQGG